MLDREAIFKADDIKQEEVKVPEWGGDTVIVRALTGAERDAFEQNCIDRRRGSRIDIKGLKADLLIVSVRGQDGGLMFKPEHKAALLEKSAQALERLYNVAQRLSGLAPEDVEELAGNFGGDLSESSGSD